VERKLNREYQLLKTYTLNNVLTCSAIHVKSYAFGHENHMYLEITVSMYVNALLK